MAVRERYSQRPQAEGSVFPFADAQEAWFWFIQAQRARDEGARFTAGAGFCPRPCEPTDILKVVERLYRARRISMDHILVLRHYGRRMMPPDRDRTRERRAHFLWTQAMGEMELALVGKGIVALPVAGGGMFPAWGTA